MQSYSPYQFAIVRILSGCLVIASGFSALIQAPEGAPASMATPLAGLAIVAGISLAAGIYRRASAVFALVSCALLWFLPLATADIPDLAVAPIFAAFLVLATTGGFVTFMPFTSLMLVMFFAQSGEALRAWPARQNASDASANLSWRLSSKLVGFALVTAFVVMPGLLLVASLINGGDGLLSPHSVAAPWFARSGAFIICSMLLLIFTGLNLTWLLPPWPQPDPTAKGLPGGQPDYAHPIVFFDGVCNLCNSSVDFLVRADRAKLLRFAPLQGETAARLLSADAVTGMDTMVFRDARGSLHRRSEAILRIGVQMGGLWRVGGLGLLIPRGLRDALYKIIARNRYRWFGKKDSCRMPTSAERALFLN